jgi:dephospho-CoA kinase
MLIIGLTGTNASGKTCVVRLLREEGFTYFSLSDIIRDELTSLGLEHSRENLRIVGNRLREQYGASVLADRTKQKLPDNTNCVIDSIRNALEVESLRVLKNFYFISVDAPIEIRFERARARGRNESAVDLKSFQAIEDLEKSSISTAQNLNRCMEMADFNLYNEGTIQEFSDKIKALMEHLWEIQTD